LIIGRKLTYPYLNRVRGYFVSGSEINILLVREENGSLFQLLHKKDNNKGSQINLKLKYKIAKEIATGMHFLHSQETPIVHGHLTSQNILVINMRLFDRIVNK
jgi:serine/threonine protein kinase